MDFPLYTKITFLTEKLAKYADFSMADIKIPIENNKFSIY